MQAWRQEQEHPTDLSADLSDAGTEATLARRAQRSSGENLDGVSGFGTMRDRMVQRQQRQLEDAAAVQALEEAAGSQIRDSEEVLVVSTMRGAFMELVVARASNDLKSHMQAIHQLCRALASRNSAREAQEEQDARKTLRTNKIAAGIDHSSLSESMGCELRISSGSMPTMQYVFNFIGWAAKRIAEMKQQRGKLIAPAQKLWESEHELEADLGDKLPPLPAGYAPTVCRTEGYGRCLCCGHGAVLRIAKKRLAATIARLMPAKSLERRWGKRGFVVVKLGSSFYHLSLLYLNPRRPTFSKMDLSDDWFQGRRVVVPVSTGDKEFAHVHDFEAVEQMGDLSGPLQVTLFKLVSFKVLLPNWLPAKKLTIEKWERASAKATTREFQFWKGEAVELAEEAKKAEQEKRRREARDLRDALGIPHPKRAPRRKSHPAPKTRSRPPARDVQKPPSAAGAIVEALPIADVMPGAAGDFGLSDASSLEHSTPLNSDGEHDRDWGAAFADDKPEKSMGKSSVAGEADASDSDNLEHLFASDDEANQNMRAEISTPVVVAHPKAAPATPTDYQSDSSTSSASVSYVPTSPVSVAGKDGLVSGVPDGASDGDSELMDVPLPSKTVVGAEGRVCTNNLDHEAPPGCSFRRFSRGDAETPYWLGKLPAARRDDCGKRSRMRVVGEVFDDRGHKVLRSEEEARSEVLCWLLCWG